MTPIAAIRRRRWMRWFSRPPAGLDKTLSDRLAGHGKGLGASFGVRRHVPPLPRRTARRLAAWMVAAVGLLGVVGWGLRTAGLAALADLFPHLMPNDLALLGLLALALQRLDTARQRGRGRFGVLAAAAGIVALSLPGLLGAPGWSSLAVGPAPLAGDGAFTSFRTSLGVGCSALLLGATLMAATVRGERARAITQVLALAVAGLALVAVVGLTFRVVRLSVALPAMDLSLPLALSLLAASFSLLLLRPSPRLAPLREHDSAGSNLVRRLFPAAIAVPLLAGWLQALGQIMGWFGPLDSEVVLTVCMIVASMGLILWTSRKVDELDVCLTQAEFRANTQQRWLEVTLAHIGDAVITVNGEMRISFLNRAAESLLETRSSEALGKPVADLLVLVDEQSGERLRCPLETAFAEMRPVVLDGEPAVQRPGGTLQAVDVTANPIVDHRERVLVGVLVLRDVSAHRARAHAEREAYAALDRRVAERTRVLNRTMSVLRESTTLLRTIAASTPELIVAKSRDGRIMMVNPAALQSLGLSRAQVIGRREEELLGDAAEIRRMLENDQRVIESGRPILVEEDRQTRAGLRTFLVTKSPLRDEDGKVFGLVGVAKDITERKRAQSELEQLLVAEHRLRGEAERANRAKDEFLAMVSHELRSPLNALKGWGQVLAGMREPEAGLVSRAAEAIKRNIDHQTRLIDDLLDTSRIISGKLDLNIQRLNMVDVVNAARDFARDQAKLKHIDLRFFTESPMMPVDGDVDRLQQVLNNLLSNSIKFTPEGGLIQVHLRQTGKRIELSVSDTGMGIDPEFLPHVFDRFSQADTSMTRRYLGLGIGLALVRNLVELHGGEVQASSAGSGSGSVFMITLPQPEGCAGSPRSTAMESARGRRSSLDGVLALVLDDDPDARDVMRLMLGRAGAEVRLYDSGEDLLDTLRSTPAMPESMILLFDIAMPGESGFDLLKRVRELDKLPFLPAIAVTALTQLDCAQFTLAGFQGRVGKPVDERLLVDTIVEVLEVGDSLRAEGIADN